MDYFKKALEEHRKHKGKLEVKSKVPLKDKEDLSIYYTPGVAEPCKQIAKNPSEAYDYTWKNNSVAVVSDGSAVLGL
jgi:malate dehydrogenase (oxaloacetate-decarboxylating)